MGWRERLESASATAALQLGIQSPSGRPSQSLTIRGSSTERRRGMASLLDVHLVLLVRFHERIPLMLAYEVRPRASNSSNTVCTCEAASAF